MRFLVLRYGRTRVWIALLAAFLLALVIIVRAVVDDRSISPEEALANGGHVVTVHAFCRGGAHMRQGHFEVETQSGRPPEHDSGDLSGNQAQIVVGPDWIGRVRIVQPVFLFFERSKVSSLIGEPFGWDDRSVHFDEC